jgi:hypothetical protein
MGRIAHYTVPTGKCWVKYHNLCSGLGTGCRDYFSVVDENSYSFIGRQAKFWRVLVVNGPLRGREFWARDTQLMTSCTDFREYVSGCR